MAQIARGEQSIRKAFSVARRYAPSIVFIDEIDAFAQDRQSGAGSTLLVNELLTEMDGFEDNSSHPVFVIAATNFGSAHSLRGENGVSPMMKPAIEEADRILKTEMEKTIKIVEEHKDLIVKFADALIEKGHLGKVEIERLMSE